MMQKIERFETFKQDFISCSDCIQQQAIEHMITHFLIQNPSFIRESVKCSMDEGDHIVSLDEDGVKYTVVGGRAIHTSTLLHMLGPYQTDQTEIVTYQPPPYDAED